ncbi:ATP-NAD kinase family protein [Aliiroseovarius sp. YM-037]|uniref:ATP-NAD kinase family protein n=1 Tax=Aliiroseovarius sp. YM-037 TaxID=3341728 RepID=UPI003A7FFE6B
MQLGLIVNPVAGLGGAVGLKGTDGPDTVAEALRRGAIPLAGLRTRAALERLAARAPGTAIVTAPGPLGADWVAGLPLEIKIIDIGEPSSTARDTREAVGMMREVDLMVFAGGDGTARDVAAALPAGVPMLGIPCGVKMHSGVFAISPGAAGAMMADVALEAERVAWDDTAEVMDIDEEALREGVIAPRLFGLARVPVARNLMQAAKGGPRQDEAAALSYAAAAIARGMEPDTLYIIGPGTSAGAVMLAAGHTPTTLGTDALLDGRVVARDADAATLETLAADRQVHLVLGVTGQQGFLLGRGNQQISHSLIAQAGREGLIVLATEAKLSALAQPRLWVDTGDPTLDAALSGFIRVQTGAMRQMMMRIGES